MGEKTLTPSQSKSRQRKRQRERAREMLKAQRSALQAALLALSKLDSATAALPETVVTEKMIAARALGGEAARAIAPLV